MILLEKMPKLLARKCGRFCPVPDVYLYLVLLGRHQAVGVMGNNRPKLGRITVRV